MARLAVLPIARDHGENMSDPAETSAPLLKTPLNAAHRALGGRMVGFAGYDMPVQYPLGVLGEHLWTRAHAGLFDVSHMGQAFLVAPDGRHETVARFLETLVPADIVNLPLGKQRYSQFLNAEGGILDDLMITRSASLKDDGALGLVVNAACKQADYAHIEAHLPDGFRLVRREDRALLALQGPEATAVLALHCPEAASLSFMEASVATFDGKPCSISRSGYTGEDGYEISAVAGYISTISESLLAHDSVKPIGLGARDSLRLEAGLCLYGHDIDTSTNPVEAALTWSIQKRRREEGGFPGAKQIQHDLLHGPKRKRVGIQPEGRQPAREGTEIFAEGRKIGSITSGGFGPSMNAPVAMGYVEAAFAAPGTRLTLLVRGKELSASVVNLPFIPNRFYRKPA
jgi:aminomethyltransferase